MKILKSLWITVFLLPVCLTAQNAYSVSEPEIGIVEKLDSYVPGNIQLFDIKGDTVSLESLVNKPTVLSLVYYRCPGICSPLMNGIAEVIQKSDMKIGEEYQVLTVSFDERETYDLAGKKRQNYLSHISKPEAKEGWFFFAADSTNIARLTNSVGFRYKKSGNDFTHAATLIVLSPERKITRYLNGVQFLPFELKMALVEASKGQSRPTINKILQFCYSYDPKGQHYVINVTRVSGIIILFIMLSIFLILTIKPLFKTKTAIN